MPIQEKYLYVGTYTSAPSSASPEGRVGLTRCNLWAARCAPVLASFSSYTDCPLPVSASSFVRTLQVAVALCIPAMDSLSTCLHPAPIKCAGSCSSRRLSSTINIRSRGCLNFSDRANYLKAGSMRQLWLTGFEDGSRKRSIIQVIKAGQAEGTTQNETLQEEVKESEEVASQIEEKAAEKPTAVAEEKNDVEEGGATGKCWVLRSATSEGEGRSQEIVLGDGILVGAAPNVTGSAKSFVVDNPMVSSSHARVYGRDRRSYQNTVREYFVMDLGSTNGTYLNRSKLRPQTEVKLSRGDTLKFGDERATFVVEAQG